MMKELRFRDSDQLEEFIVKRDGVEFRIMLGGDYNSNIEIARALVSIGYESVCSYGYKSVECVD